MSVESQKIADEIQEELKQKTTTTQRFFKDGKESTPEDADELIINIFDETGKMVDETVMHRVQKR